MTAVAITPDGNAVVIDANVCAGCGSCASVCPTGAASYALPSVDALMRRLRTLLQVHSVYRRLAEAGRRAVFANAYPVDYLRALGYPADGEAEFDVLRRVRASATTGAQA